MNPILWEPKNISHTNLFHFQQFLIQNKFLFSILDYKSFHKWSVDNLEIFWREFLAFSGFLYEGSTTNVLQIAPEFQNSIWFPDLYVNFTENIISKLLKLNEIEKNNTLILSAREDGSVSHISIKDFLSNFYKFRYFLRKNGVKKGTRVAACMPNIPETIYFMLASTSLGAVFSSSSPDFGINAVYDRFNQIEPEVLLVTDSYNYKGKKIYKIKEYEKLASMIPSIKFCIVVPFDSKEEVDLAIGMVPYSEILNSPEDLSPFEKFSFSHPVFTMYSSGTTGLPKCILQGSGVLLNHLKEHILHIDLTKSDTLFYFTTCGWMMWNWMVSSLAIGSRLFLFEGSPFHPDPGILWNFAQDEGITVFGTSAGYLAALEKSRFVPNSKNLTSLRLILSTGSPLLPEQFDFVYSKISNHIQLSSISGGTDLNGCFVLGNPFMPVRRGEIQGIGLGMSAEIWSQSAQKIIDMEGELVCTKPFPSMPIGFGTDPDGMKYKKAYFETYPNVWRHGDYGIELSSGGFLLLGRSDATLNPGGVRIGTAEIYRIVEKIDGIEDSLAVGINHEGEEKVVLFLKVREGTTLNIELDQKIRQELKNQASPRHVPHKMIEVPGIPYTRNLKKVELIIKNIFEGRPVLNKESLHNPEILDFYQSMFNSLF